MLPKSQLKFSLAYIELSKHLDEVVPLDKIKVNKRRGSSDRPSAHALKARGQRAEINLGIRKLRTLVQKKKLGHLFRDPDVLEWGRRAHNFQCVLLSKLMYYLYKLLKS